MEYEFPFGTFHPEKQDHLFRFSTFLGIFQWDEPTKRVPFTAEPEIPEILTKWKAPVASLLFLNSGTTVIGVLVLWNLCLIMNAYILSFAFLAVSCNR